MFRYKKNRQNIDRPTCLVLHHILYYSIDLLHLFPRIAIITNVCFISGMMLGKMLVFQMMTSFFNLRKYWV